MNKASDTEILSALQRGLPIGPHPFDMLAGELGISEEELLAKINSWMQEGKARRLGGVFDARRLGYRSVLCAVKTTPETIDDVAAEIVQHPGITHCYLRGWPEDTEKSLPGAPLATDDFPDLWFTFAVLSDEFDEQLQALSKSIAPAKIIMMPAVKRFKIDVIFDPATRERSETFPGAPLRNTEDNDTQPATTTFSAQERKLINILSNNIPVTHSPFKQACEETGLSIDKIVELLQHWQDAVIMRRMAIILRHRKIGFKANAMCTWYVNTDLALEKGRTLASFSEVTH
ncbi:hypothetical protein BVX94_00740, partial [bacterium B17]